MAGVADGHCAVVEDLLRNNGGQRHDKDRPARHGAVFYLTDAFDGVDGHAERCDAEEDTDEQSDQRFDSLMAVRVVAVRRGGPETDANEHGDIRREIGQTVDGVGDTGLAVGEKTDGKFACGKQDVDKHAPEGDSTNWIHKAVLRKNLMLLRHVFLDDEDAVDVDFADLRFGSGRRAEP